jgi:acetyltransferase
VFDGLSPASRVRRFHAPVKQLTPRALAALLAVDGDRQVAFVAETGRGRRRVPVGIARYVREPDGSAEIAICVVDRAQGRGVGTRLLRRLVEHARRHGIRELHGDLLSDNEAVRRLLTRVLPAARFTPQGVTTRVSSVLTPSPITLEDVLADLAVAPRPAA